MFELTWTVVPTVGATFFETISHQAKGPGGVVYTIDDDGQWDLGLTITKPWTSPKYSTRTGSGGLVGAKARAAKHATALVKEMAGW